MSTSYFRCPNIWKRTQYSGREKPIGQLILFCYFIFILHKIKKKIKIRIPFLVFITVFFSGECKKKKKNYYPIKNKNKKETIRKKEEVHKFTNLEKIRKKTFKVKSQTNLPTVKLIVCVSVCLCVYSVYTAQGLQCDEN